MVGPHWAPLTYTLVFVIGFICPEWKMWRFTPFIHPFRGRHTGRKIQLELDEMVESLRLDKDDLDCVCVTDNASNNKCAVRRSEHLRQYFCDVHTLQLAIADTFSKIEGNIAQFL